MMAKDEPQVKNRLMEGHIHGHLDPTIKAGEQIDDPGNGAIPPLKNGDRLTRASSSDARMRCRSSRRLN